MRSVFIIYFVPKNFKNIRSCIFYNSNYTLFIVNILKLRVLISQKILLFSTFYVRIVVVFCRIIKNKGVLWVFKLRIRELRLKKHLSQEELALRSGISQNYISLLEKGTLRTKSPTLRVIERLAKTLDVCPLELLKCNYKDCKAQSKRCTRE